MERCMNVYEVTIKEVEEMVDNGSISINLIIDGSDIQRNEVWNVKQKSSLIDTLLTDGVVPVLIFVKNDKTYMVADGKQRLLSILSFINNDYRLSKSVSKINGITIGGRKFSELSEELQEKLLSRKIKFQEEEFKSSDQVHKLFSSLNSGEKLKPIEIWRGTLGSTLPFVQEVSEHKCFESFTFTPAKLKRFADLETALDIIIEEMEPGSDHCQRAKEEFVTAKGRYNDLRKEVKECILRKLQYISDTLEDNDTKRVKEITTSVNKILIYRLAELATSSGITCEDFYEFLEKYFTDEANSYVNIGGRTSTYNKSSLVVRYEHILKEYKKTFKKLNTKKINKKANKMQA